MSVETLLAAGYATTLIAVAFALEWLSSHTHQRALRFRTAGFEYDEDHDRWECPEGHGLWPHELDRDRRLVRYRASAHVCNGCAVKIKCTDSDEGREIVRPLDPWPHSEAGRFHRGISLMLVGLGAAIALVELVRHHHPDEAALLAAVLLAAALAGRWLARDFIAHPAGFPEPRPAHGLRVAVTGADGRREPSRWASLNRTEGS